MEAIIKKATLFIDKKIEKENKKIIKKRKEILDRKGLFKLEKYGQHTYENDRHNYILEKLKVQKTDIVKSIFEDRKINIPTTEYRDYVAYDTFYYVQYYKEYQHYFYKPALRPQMIKANLRFMLNSFYWK